MFSPILHPFHRLFARTPASRRRGQRLPQQQNACLVSCPPPGADPPRLRRGGRGSASPRPEVRKDRSGLRESRTSIIRFAGARTLACLTVLLSLGLLPTATLAQTGPISGPLQAMPPHPRLEEKIRREEVRAPAHLRDEGRRAIQPAGVRAATSGSAQTINVLAIQVDFAAPAEHSSTIASDYFDKLLFAEPAAGQRRSVRDYFSKVSYGQVDIIGPKLPSTIGWQRAPETMSYYVGGPDESCTGSYPDNCQGLFEDILEIVDPQVDFSQYDNDHDGTMEEPVLLIHAGTGSEFCGTQTCIDGTIWSHSWGLPTPLKLDGVWVQNYVIMPEYYADSVVGDSTIGVFAHEMGHGFWGLPDLYDRDDSSEGIGNWSLMASGSWNGSPDGSSPAWPDAWSRIQMGYVSPTAITTDTPTLSLPQVAGNTQVLPQIPTGPTVFKLRNSTMGSQEYFLLENRQGLPGTYDEGLPGGGLLIWHVDEARWQHTRGYQNDSECKTEPHSGCRNNHYLVALEQADGLREMENNRDRGDAGDTFPGSTNNRAWTGATHPESSSWYGTPSGISVTGISSSNSIMYADVTFTPLIKGYLPMLTKAGPPAQPWTTIVSENFEGAFPGASWEVVDNSDSDGGEYYWAKRSCAAASGSYSAWAVGGGAQGSGLGCGANYENDVDSYMIYGPFSLAGATAADLKFKANLNLEEGYDALFVLASTDGTHFNYGGYVDENTNGWAQGTLDLSYLSDGKGSHVSLLGQSQVWVALDFDSDQSGNVPVGAYVDDVVVRKCTAAACTASQAAANETLDSITALHPLQTVRVK